MKPRKRKSRKELLELLQFMKEHLVDDGNGGKCIRVMIPGVNSRYSKTTQSSKSKNNS